ncbi:hypothetical protein [Actinokineospora sp. NBRC 105648]|uniref:hypothetical protein n=1 Tax=Actinokineospora sp. NBRC 105648 TaxID=3032206 RepID=UPI0025534330|nr:hypothetical protein [Actinokineospora sp. NBRC 105648]
MPEAEVAVGDVVTCEVTSQHAWGVIVTIIGIADPPPASIDYVLNSDMEVIRDVNDYAAVGSRLDAVVLMVDRVGWVRLGIRARHFAAARLTAGH